MSDQERDKLSKLPSETDDEGNDVEAHKLSKWPNEADDDDNDVEAHKHGGKDS